MPFKNLQVHSKRSDLNCNQQTITQRFNSSRKEKILRNTSNTHLGLPEKVAGTSGVKFFRTISNIVGLNGMPISISFTSFFVAIDELGMVK